jgi:hypothetical protein
LYRGIYVDLLFIDLLKASSIFFDTFTLLSAN